MRTTCNDALHQAGLDMAAMGLIPAGVQSRGHCGEGVDRRAHVDGDNGDAVRNAVLAPVFGHQPGIGLEHRVHRRPFRQRSFQSEAGHRHIQDARLLRRHRPVAEAEPVDHAGAEALEEHVRALDHFPQDGAAGIVLQVERDRAFAQVRRDRIGGVIAVDRAERPRPVAGVGRFHLDDVGAVLGEHHRAIRPGHALAEIDHFQPFERRRVAHGFAPLASSGSIVADRPSRARPQPKHQEQTS